jgi:hypothetical protein
MLCVYSFIENPLFYSKGQEKFAFISNSLVKKLGYNTILYIEEKNYKNFANIPFDDIRIISKQEISKIPNTIWAASKLIALSKIEEPFFHLDFDCFIFNNKFEKLIENKKFFFFHEEPWEKYEKNFSAAKLLAKQIGDDFPIDLKKADFIPKNFAVFGTNDICQVKNINIASQKIISILCKYKKDVFENESFLSAFESIRGLNRFLLTVLIEQIIFYNMCVNNLSGPDIGRITNNYNLGANHILKDFLSSSFKDTGILHLWGHKYSKGVEQFVDKLEYKFNYLK